MTNLALTPFSPSFFTVIFFPSSYSSVFFHSHTPDSMVNLKAALLHSFTTHFSSALTILEHFFLCVNISIQFLFFKFHIHWTPPFTEIVFLLVCDFSVAFHVWYTNLCNVSRVGYVTSIVNLICFVVSHTSKNGIPLL